MDPFKKISFKSVTDTEIMIERITKANEKHGINM